MPLIDIILLIIIAGFGMFGLWFGLIHTLGSLIGTIAGIYLATRFYEPMAGWLTNITGWGGNVPKVIMFIVAFIVINRLVGFAFWIVDKVLSLVTRLPFIAGINRFLGLIFDWFGRKLGKDYENVFAKMASHDNRRIFSAGWFFAGPQSNP